MSVANVVMMDFESEEALLEFQTNYDKNAPTLYSEAEILLFIRTGDDKSALAISVYPNDEAREAGKKRAASRVSENFEPLFKDTLRLSGKVMTKHIQQKLKLNSLGFFINASLRWQDKYPTTVVSDFDLLLFHQTGSVQHLTGGGDSISGA